MLGPFNTDILRLGKSKSSDYKMMTNRYLFYELFILFPNSSSRVCMGGADWCAPECRDEESQARHSESEKCAIMKSA
jgi:hypothetical protein